MNRVSWIASDSCSDTQIGKREVARSALLRASTSQSRSPSLCGCIYGAVHWLRPRPAFVHPPRCSSGQLFRGRGDCLQLLRIRRSHCSSVGRECCADGRTFRDPGSRGLLIGSRLAALVYRPVRVQLAVGLFPAPNRREPRPCLCGCSPQSLCQVHPDFRTLYARRTALTQRRQQSRVVSQILRLAWPCPVRLVRREQPLVDRRSSQGIPVRKPDR